MSKQELQKEVTKTVYLCFDASSTKLWGEPRFSMLDFNPKGYTEYTILGEQEVTMKLPEGFDPVTGMIESLRAQKQKVLAEAQVAANAIEERISSLLALTHEG